MSGNEQPDVQHILPARQPNEQCSYNIPGATDRLIPQELIFNGRCKTADEYKQLIQLMYRLLTIKQVRFNGEVRECLGFKFVNSDLGQLLANIRASTADLANLQNTMIGLNSLLTAVTSCTVNITRGVKITCVTSFTNVEVNNALEVTCEEEGDQKDDPEYKFILFVNRFIPMSLRAVKFLHKKARQGVEFFYQVEHLKSDIHKLKVSYQRMLTSLQNRSVVNNLLNHFMVTQDDAM